jgi:hypothetical protein
LADLTVGTINQLYYNTNLYDQMQYQKVNAKTWEDKAYIMNKEKELIKNLKQWNSQSETEKN